MLQLIGSWYNRNSERSGCDNLPRVRLVIPGWFKFLRKQGFFYLAVVITFSGRGHTKRQVELLEMHCFTMFVTHRVICYFSREVGMLFRGSNERGCLNDQKQF